MSLTNTFSVTKGGNPLGTVSSMASYNVYDAAKLTITEAVDKPNYLYFTGDAISFTITLNNTEGAVINGVTVADTIDNAVTVTEYTLNGGSSVATGNAFSLVFDTAASATPGDLPIGTTTIIISGTIK